MQTFEFNIIFFEVITLSKSPDGKGKIELIVFERGKIVELYTQGLTQCARLDTVRQPFKYSKWSWGLWGVQKSQVVEKCLASCFHFVLIFAIS